MTTHDILNTISHRPWQLPQGAWQYYQEWNNAVFLHWQVSLDQLQPFVPQDLEIDLFEGMPWISIVAFTMEKVRTRRLPSFSPISNFHEINIRTYVRSGIKSGVYFLSIEGGKRVSCSIAKNLSQLPYRYSDMRRIADQYISNNTVYNDQFRIQHTPGKRVAIKTALDRWLTERYALFHDCAGSINEFDVHHVEWPLNEVEVSALKVNYPRFDALIKGKPHKVHYSKGVQVLAWPKSRTRIESVPH